jgi:hypothetical protein
MRQLTLRVGDRLADRLKAVAAERGQSVNAYAEAVLSAAVDPELADGELARLRERLARAGLLAPGVPGPRAGPPDADVAEARAAAASGRSLSSLVSEDRR